MPDTFVSLASRVLGHAEAAPNRRAVVGDGAPLTYVELATRAGRAARSLLARGLVPGGDAKVGILAQNGIDFAVAFVACQLAGVAAVPLPGLLLADAPARMLIDSGTALVFHDAYHAPLADAVARELGAASVQFVPMDVGGAWIGAADGAALPAAIEPGWLSDLIYSSGTTGTPKGIAQTVQGRSAQHQSLQTGLGVTPESHLLQTVGLSSNFGLASLTLTLWAGGTFFCFRKFSGAAVVELLATEPIDHAWFAPATLVRTLDAPGFRTAVAGKRCTRLCAGAPLSVEAKRSVRDGWPGPFFDLYGQTETGTLTLLPIHAAPDDKLGSVGLVLPTAAVRILDDAGTPLGTDAEGEIAGHATTLMAGYHGRPDAAQALAWYDEQGRRYIKTGDVGRLDADGYLWLCDRKKDMIISGGYNIYPADLERVLQGHPAVFEVAVVGFPSTAWGETPVAFVTRRAGASATEAELKDWLNARVAKIQRVAAVVIVPELPSGSMGKILKRELRERYRERVGLLP